jgi:hypothetical protein
MGNRLIDIPEGKAVQPLYSWVNRSRRQALVEDLSRLSTYRCVKYDPLGDSGKGGHGDFGAQDESRV